MFIRSTMMAMHREQCDGCEAYGEATNSLEHAFAKQNLAQAPRQVSMEEPQSNGRAGCRACHLMFFPGRRSWVPQKDAASECCKQPVPATAHHLQVLSRCLG